MYIVSNTQMPRIESFHRYLENQTLLVIKTWKNWIRYKAKAEIVWTMATTT